MTTECSNCWTLWAELEAVQAKLEAAQAKIAALEAELRRGQRQAAPFSWEEPKPDPKPPGRRPGQGKFRRRAKPPEEAIQATFEAPLAACPECGEPLEERAAHEQVQVDLPKVLYSARAQIAVFQTR